MIDLGIAVLSKLNAGWVSRAWRGGGQSKREARECPSLFVAQSGITFTLKGGAYASARRSPTPLGFLNPELVEGSKGLPL
jgi:hypothetical protein